MSYEAYSTKKSRIKKAHDLFYIAISTTLPFILDAIQFSFEKYCTEKGLQVQKCSYSEYIKQQGQGELFSIAKGVVVSHDVSPPSGKKRKKAESLDEEKILLPQDEKNSILFLSSKIDIKDSKFASWELFSYTEQKPWEIKNCIASWCEWYLQKEYKTSCDPVAVGYLIEANESHFFAIQKELDKLSSYTLGQKSIQMQDVMELSDISKKSNLFGLLDELLACSIHGVSKELMLLETDSSTHMMQVLRFLQQQIRNLIQISFQGKDAAYVSKALEKRVEKARKLGLIRLEKWVSKAVYYEVALRNGEISEDLPGTLDSFCFSLIKSE